MSQLFYRNPRRVEEWAGVFKGAGKADDFTAVGKVPEIPIIPVKTAEIFDRACHFPASQRPETQIQTRCEQLEVTETNKQKGKGDGNVLLTCAQSIIPKCTDTLKTVSQWVDYTSTDTVKSHTCMLILEKYYCRRSRDKKNVDLFHCCWSDDYTNESPQWLVAALEWIWSREQKSLTNDQLLRSYCSIFS